MPCKPKPYVSQQDADSEVLGTDVQMTLQQYLWLFNLYRTVVSSISTINKLSLTHYNVAVSRLSYVY